MTACLKVFYTRNYSTQIILHMLYSSISFFDYILRLGIIPHFHLCGLCGPMPEEGSSRVHDPLRYEGKGNGQYQC